MPGEDTASEVSADFMDHPIVDPAPCYMFRDMPEEETVDLVATTLPHQNTLRAHLAALLSCTEADLIAAIEGQGDN